MDYKKKYLKYKLKYLTTKKLYAGSGSGLPQQQQPPSLNAELQNIDIFVNPMNQQAQAQAEAEFNADIVEIADALDFNGQELEDLITPPPSPTGPKTEHKKSKTPSKPK
tara:strand:- start:183 stop:509 length:327 start_codon:yes stop_codon:yes gene_type:complete